MNRSVRINHQIRIPQVRLIGPEGNQIGIIDTKAALAMAQEEGLDLVEVSPNAKPPVCRIMDYGKFKYEQSKKVRDARKKQHTTQLKEIKMGLKIDDHDYEFKRRHAEEFLKSRDRVKVVVVFWGREITHKDFGRRLLERFSQDLSAISAMDGPIRSEGKNMVMILTPK